jgi:2,4-dienoyl-CoA reductase-like NADH-dependent reductase (Old Yellow Enzyme family)
MASGHVNRIKQAEHMAAPTNAALVKTARPPLRLLHLVFESHDGRALVPIPKRSTSP